MDNIHNILKINFISGHFFFKKLRQLTLIDFVYKLMQNKPLND